MNVLVVDDSRSIRSIVGAYITELGHTTVDADSGEAALALFHQHDIDLVLMDIEMPGINGYDVTRKLRRDLGDSWLPIIFLSSNKSDDHFIEGITAGGDAYLFKPVNGPMLQSMVAAMGRIASIQEKLEHANKQLEKMAFLDPLTGLNNRRSMLASLNNEWGRANRNGYPLSVIILDADDFKSYNDFYGHIAGDKCLVNIAEVLQKFLLRSSDMSFRYGGEEFFVMLPETSLEGAVIVAERLRKAIEDAAIKHERSSNQGIITVSLGVAAKSPLHNTPEELIKSADKLLYQAKDNGRNCLASDQTDSNDQSVN